ncbi:MAG: type IV secretory system conjugative DNA transfer family protein [Candidatus Eremiobacteraeota bacterium]|nr:type IV secretory system conjugative DNA transfer family protein [Candidatus Eremiobacteraeota bacterium]
MSRASDQSLYRISTRQTDPVFAYIRAAGAFFLFSVLAMWGATELVAAKFHFQHALGAPLAPYLFEPWGGITWQFRFANAADPRVAGILHSFWALWGLGEFVAACIGIAIVVRSSRPQKHSDLHGSAHWATEAEVRESGLLDGDGGVYVGAWTGSGGRTRYLRHDGPEHVLAFAPTRSGKGVGLVIPTLLSWPHSVVVHDIKGENFALTSGWRADELHSRVLKFDPSSNDGSSCRYNPLAQVRLRTDFEVKDVQNIVQMLVDPDGKAAQGDEAHWIATSAALLTGVILHVLYSEADKSLGGVATFLSDPSFESPTQMYQYMLNATHDGSVTHPVVAMSARDMLNKDPKEATSVLSTAIRFLTLFRDPIVARNTSTSDFTVEELMNGDRPLSLYLVVPPSDIDRLKPLTRLVLNQILRGLTSEMKFDEGRSVANYRHRLLLMIDELPSLGRLEIVQTSLAFMAGYGIKAYLIAQDVAQLSAAYGGASGRDETIMANCHVQVAFAPNKIETMELLSKLAGSMTVRSESRSYSGRRVGVRAHVMVNSQDTERPLLTPDEARRLPDDDALIFIAGRAPIYAKKIRYFQDRTFTERARIAPPATVPATERVAEHV